MQMCLVNACVDQTCSQWGHPDIVFKCSLLVWVQTGQFFSEGGPSSSSALEISPNRLSNNFHRPEVLDPMKEAAKWPQASFSSRAALALSVAESCSMNKD